MATRCFWPPDSAFVSRFVEALQAHLGERVASRAGASWAVGTPRFSGPKATSFSTRLATSWSSGFWNTMPALLRMK